tara:strand:- start:67 stop:453 length:387 start_codon:yes stop_codon:yes gene_type:complete
MKRIKTGGRQKGTPNKITSEIRDRISVLVSGTMDSIDISTFTKMEKIKLLQVLCQYIITKLQSADYQIVKSDMPSAVSIKFIDNSGKDISDQHQKDIEHMRNMDENDRGLAMDMHNIIRGDKSKCIIN